MTDTAALDKVRGWRREASTIEDEASVEDAREAWQQMRAGVKAPA